MAHTPLYTPSSAERVNLAHNMKTFMAASGMEKIETFRKSKGKQFELPWTTVQSILSGKEIGFRASTMAKIMGLLSIDKPEDIFKPREVVATLKGKPGKEVAVAKAEPKKEVSVVSHPRNYRVGPGRTAVKRVVVPEHTRAPQSETNGERQVDRRAKTDNAVLIGLGSETIYVPITKLKHLSYNTEECTVTLELYTNK